MAKSVQYHCERDTKVDGIYIGANMPFWTEAEPDADWIKVPNADVGASPAEPYLPDSAA